MSVTLYSVKKGSAFHRAGIEKGDELLSVNGNDIYDVFDYRFYCDSPRLAFRFRKPCGKTQSLLLSNLKGDVQDMLGFESFLMDKHQHCRNKCTFCFIDQMPPGMRESLYFKDDDSRLSFLFGNYITLTGISEREVERIIKMHISPINISVHTMNPDLRVKMMSNKHAGESLSIIKRFSDADIEMNTQLVLCPGINDGDELRYSLEELSKHYPAVKSIAAIPVGLTKFRENLPEIKPYTRERALEVINIVDEFNSHFLYFNKRRLAYAADEFFIIAGLPLPSEDYYDEYPQLDNGVGLCTLLKSEFMNAINDVPKNTQADNRKLTLITGEAAYPLMRELTDMFKEKFDFSDLQLLPVKNNFFGDTVSVAGLLTGRDIIGQCREKISGGEVFIPRVMLKSETEQVFLDDISLDELAEALGAKVIPLENDGYVLLEALLHR